MRFVKQWTRVQLLLGVLTLSLWPPSALAQVTTADVVGTVSDSTGALLPGVTITASNAATGNMETVGHRCRGQFSDSSTCAGPVPSDDRPAGFQNSRQ